MRHSTTGLVFLNAEGAVSWLSRLQLTVATSTAEAEYTSCCVAAKEGLWSFHLAKDLKLKQVSVSIQCDNQVAMKMVENPMISV